MHEISILQSVLETAQAYARKGNARHIHLIRLRIGVLAGVVEESLNFAFEVLSEDSLARGGKLEIERVLATYQCRDCGKEFSPGKSVCFECPDCGHGHLTLVRGRELELVHLEVS